MLVLNDISVKKGDQYILKNINISLRENEVVGIIGSNGAGKTTLLKTIAGLIRPDSGTIKLFDLLFNLESSLKIKKDVGYLADSPFLYEQLSPIENLTFFGKLYNIDNIEEKAAKLIQEVGLGFFRYEPVNTFSKGMIQRLALAKAIINNPKLLLLDEPYTNLDQNGINTVNNFISRNRFNGSLILLVTHDFEHAVTLCDRFIILNKGQIIDIFDNEEKSIDILKARYQGKVDNL